MTPAACRVHGSVSAPGKDEPTRPWRRPGVGPRSLGKGPDGSEAPGDRAERSRKARVLTCHLEPLPSTEGTMGKTAATTPSRTSLDPEPGARGRAVGGPGAGAHGVARAVAGLPLLPQRDRPWAASRAPARRPSSWTSSSMPLCGAIVSSQPSSWASSATPPASPRSWRGWTTTTTPSATPLGSRPQTGRVGARAARGPGGRRGAAATGRGFPSRGSLPGAARTGAAHLHRDAAIRREPVPVPRRLLRGRRVSA